MDVNVTACQIQNQIRTFGFRPNQLLSWNDVGYVECEILSNRSSEKLGTIIEDTEIYTIIAAIDFNVKLYKDVLFEVISEIMSKRNTHTIRLCASKQIINAQDNHG